MATLLICLFGLSFSEPDTSLLTKEEITHYLLSDRALSLSTINKLELERIDAAFLPVLKDTAAEFAPLYLSRYFKYFEQAADSFDLRLELLLAVALTESYGRSDAVSYAGAKGIMQMMKSAARESGLKVNSVVDERLDPIKCIFAGARYLAKLKKRFGEREDLMLASYHMGPGNMATVLKLARLEGLGSSWPEIYFGAKPSSKLGIFLDGLDDYSKEYYFSIRAAERLLELPYGEYRSLFYAYRHVLGDQLKADYRFYIWLCPSNAFECVSDVEEAAETGILVPVGDLEKFGFDLSRGREKSLLWVQPVVFNFLRFLGPLINDPKPLRIIRLTEALENDSLYLFRGELPMACFGRSVFIEAPKNAITRKKFDQIIYRLAILGWISRAKDEKGNYLIVLSEAAKVISFFDD